MCFLRTKQIVEPLFNGFVDYHCHILPGVDDGIRTFEDSLKVLSLYNTEGVRMVYLTPHIMEDVPNTIDALNKRFGELKEYIREKGVSVPDLSLGAENMLDRLFEERLENGQLLTLGAKHLLVETSYYNPPYNMKELLFKISAMGYLPILAHPERYCYMSSSSYRDLKELGIFFQMNLSSLLGFYGDTVKKKSEKLLSEGAYDFVGTDLHRVSLFDYCRKSRLSSKVYGQLKELLANNSLAL